jgi:hypothetical protein
VMMTQDATNLPHHQWEGCERERKKMDHRARPPGNAAPARGRATSTFVQLFRR